MNQPGPLSSLTIDELKLLYAFATCHAQAVQDMARWVGVMHQATLQKDLAAFRTAKAHYQAAHQHGRECHAAVRLLQGKLLESKSIVTDSLTDTK